MFEQQIEIIGALELGILPMGNIDEMLNTLSPEEAHSTKRKYRKIKRQLLKKHAPDVIEHGEVVPPFLERRLVNDHCKKVGKKIFENNEK